jgi:hypothetical protein
LQSGHYTFSNYYTKNLKKGKPYHLHCGETLSRSPLRRRWILLLITSDAAAPATGFTSMFSSHRRFQFLFRVFIYVSPQLVLLALLLLFHVLFQVPFSCSFVGVIVV